MTEKELRSMSKIELLEMLRRQELEIEQLTAEKTRSERQLDDRRVNIEQAGSLADASLLLTGVLKAAQDAADVYLDNIKTLESEKATSMEKLERETQEKVASIYSDAERRRAVAEGETRQMLANAQRIMDWHSEQLAAMRAGFNEALRRMGVAETGPAAGTDRPENEQ